MFRTGFRSAHSSAVTLGALSMAAVLVLSGCSGSGDEPGAEAATGGSGSTTPNSASASASGTASASASPTPTQPAAAYKPASAEGPAENVPLPVMPELAKQESKEGLEAFAKYWYGLMNYGFESGDATLMRNISAPECVLCQRAYEMLDIGYENDDWISGGKLTVHGTQSNYVLTSKGQYQVLVHVEQDPLEYRGPEGQIYERDEGLSSDTVHMIEASFSEGRWYTHNAVIIK